MSDCWNGGWIVEASDSWSGAGILGGKYCGVARKLMDVGVLEWRLDP